jgi:hypothetical protein
MKSGTSQSNGSPAAGSLPWRWRWTQSGQSATNTLARNARQGLSRILYHACAPCRSRTIASSARITGAISATHSDYTGGTCLMGMMASPINVVRTLEASGLRWYT